MDTIEIEMVLTKSTKNTNVYSDDSENAPIPTLYIKKSALPMVPPKKIVITVDKR